MTYLFTLLALVGLTALSWALAHVDLGAANTAVALTIAAIKASVVALVFMEIRHASLPARTVGLVTILFILFLCLGMVADVGIR